MIIRENSSLLGESVAVFSNCLQYRYRLWRIWDKELPTICYLMLNPSTADELENDATVERCQRRAISMGFGRMDIINLFALRSKDPSDLYASSNPTGGVDNDVAIMEAGSLAKMVVCGWGDHGLYSGRSMAVRRMLASAGIEVFALSVNASGEPRHPLYISYTSLPVPYRI